MRIIFLILLAGIIAGVIFLRKPVAPEPSGKTETTIESTKIKPNAEIVIRDNTFLIYWQEIRENLILIPNFEPQLTTSQIKEEYSCAFGANGGFYRKDFRPIGLFVADEKELSSQVSNRTFNGFFLQKANGGLALTTQVPTGRMKFAVQSGPYMTRNTMLRIQNDEPARRVIVGRSDSHWYFLAITQKDNSFSGPLLADVPEILGKLPITIIEALNLDGGSASAFYNKAGVRLGELTSVGSFFCGR